MAVYWAWDPADGGLFPRCAFKAITGWDCPGCGSQRALHALLHGHVAEAWRANPYFLLAVPSALILGWVEMTRERHPALYRSVYRPATFIIILFLTIGWWIYRNL